MSKKLTPWFINGDAPVRAGVYNVSCRKKRQSGAWYARWDGATWYGAHQNIREAQRESLATGRFNHWNENGSWRGLVSPETRSAA